MKLPSFIRPLFLLFLFVTFFTAPAFSASPGDVVINEAAFKEAEDWIELYVISAGSYEGLRIYKGTVLKKEFPLITTSSGDYIVLHFGSDTSDESDVTGKGSNGYWDIYTSLSGLTGTDDVIRIQRAGTISISEVDTIDAVIWSNDSGSFTGSEAMADDLVAASHWDTGTAFSTNDSNAWIDSNDISVGKSIGRDASSVDSNSKNDWSIFSSFTPGSVNTVSPTPTPALTPTPTFTPTPTEAVSGELTPTPTPQITLMISFSPPQEVQVDKEYLLTVKLENADANSSYYLKALIGETDNASEMREGKTKSEDKEKWLAWNGTWSKMPILQTNASGVGERVIEIKTDDDIAAGNYFLVIRTRKIDKSTNFDSGAKTLNVTALNSEEPANTENTEEFAEDAENTQDDVTKYENLSTIFIAEAREMEDGEWVQVEGVVTAQPELLGSRVMYIEDESGGIKILLDRKDRDDINLSDMVRITGKLGESFNERYIKVSTASGVEILGQVQLPEASLVQTGEIGEEYEGKLVVISGKVTATSGSVFYLDDGSGGTKIYIKSSTGIEKPKMRKGYYLEIRGICSQYRDGYRILPRYQGDLLVSQDPIQEGSILGTVATLPETGFHTNDFGLIALGIGLILRRLVQ